VGREHDEIAGVLIEKMNDFVRWCVSLAERKVFYFKSKFLLDCRDRVHLVQDTPLHQQPAQPYLQGFQAFPYFAFKHMQDV
jgi:hypothetical protein